MNLWIDSPGNLIDSILTLSCWVIVLAVVAYFYRKNTNNVSFWWVLLVTFIGMFTFDFTLTISGERASLPLLPLGVWILYGVFRLQNRQSLWKRYRLFAWIGFFASFLFFFASLLGLMLQD